MAVDLHEPDTRTPGWSATPELLSSVEVARFVAQGFLLFDGIVGDEINSPALTTLTNGLPGVEYGASVEEAFGPESLGIILVRDLPAEYAELRVKLLCMSSYLANLNKEELGMI